MSSWTVVIGDDIGYRAAMELQFEKTEPAAASTMEVRDPDVLPEVSERSLMQEQTERLLDALNKEAKRRNLCRDISKVTGYVGLGSLLCILVLYLIASHILGYPPSFEFKLDGALAEWSNANSSRGISVGLGWPVITAIILGFHLAAKRARRRQTHNARSLAEFDDLRAVGPLVDAVGMGDAGLQQLAEESLSKLLPQLKATDSELLSPVQRDVLRKRAGRVFQAEIALQFGKRRIPLYRRRNANDEFLVALLKAWEQIGGEEELKVVEGLAAGKGLGANASVQAAAEACLPALRNRVDEDRAKATLLRPAAAEASVDTLVRPVTAPRDVNIDILLKPSQPE